MAFAAAAVSSSSKGTSQVSLRVRVAGGSLLLSPPPLCLLPPPILLILVLLRLLFDGFPIRLVEATLLLPPLRRVGVLLLLPAVAAAREGEPPLELTPATLPLLAEATEPPFFFATSDTGSTSLEGPPQPMIIAL